MIRWGIIGAGNIAHRFAESLSQIDGAELHAVANRTLTKANAFKEQHQVHLAYANYQELLDNPTIDIVYIALLHRYHYEWIKKAILANKAILCEKPVVMQASELAEILLLLKQKPVFFMEAMKSRFTPAYEKALQLLNQGAIGEITQIETSLRRSMPRENTSYHYDPIQGGCLLDMGIYNISLFEAFIDDLPRIERIQAVVDEQGVESVVEASLTSKTLQLDLEVGFDYYKDAHATFIGSNGRLTIPNFNRPTQVILSLANEEALTFNCPYIIDDFAGEIIHVMDCYQKGLFESPRMSWTASLRCSKMIDLLKQATKA